MALTKDASDDFGFTESLRSVEEDNPFHQGITFQPA